MLVAEKQGTNLAFNGINGATGGYLLPTLTAADVAALARGQRLQSSASEQRHLRELKRRSGISSRIAFGLVHGVDSRKISETGWGVIFSAQEPGATREALQYLLEQRKSQAGALYKEYVYHPGEDEIAFLSRYGIGPGPVDPNVAPYYLLLVGDPEALPYRLQYHLDAQFAVGRLSFDAPEDYARYAQSVVDAEGGKTGLGRTVALFGVENPDDRATYLSATELVRPLGQDLPKALKDRAKDWQICSYLGAQATKARLATLLGGAQTPALLFTASHGMGFPLGDPRQGAHQGALLCQDWPGPSAWHQEIPPDFYFAGDDVTATARVHGLISFHFACFGAGTPQRDDYGHTEARPPEQIAARAFVAGLPKRLLAHPNGGALAVFGHVERAWGCSFVWQNAGRQIAVFTSAFNQLLDGYPVGAAMAVFSDRYAQLATALNGKIEDTQRGSAVDDYTLAELWTANNDARSYVLLGDPAVRLPAAAGAPPTRSAPAHIVGVASPDQHGAATPPGGRTEPEPRGREASEPGRETHAATATIVVPLEITVRLGMVDGQPGAEAAPRWTLEGAPERPSERVNDDASFAIAIDRNYDEREGYDPKFLGTGSLVVPLPKLSAEQAQVAALVKNAPPHAPHELRYHHFSVVVNAARGLAFFTAVNIDGELATHRKALQRRNDLWAFDPRIDRSAQVGNDLYAKSDLDRGHLIRRLDPAWGKTVKVAKSANDDTFHFTNCSPQHFRFNEGKNLWAGLEDYLLEKAVDESKRMIVFTGPVFRTNDRVYRDVQLPMEYWKVAVVPRPGGRLAALGFLVSQAGLLRSVSFGPADVAKTFQTSIREIEARTGLDFGKVRDGEAVSVDSFASGGAALRELRTLEDIRLSHATIPSARASALSFELPVRPAAAPQAPAYELLAFDENSSERTDSEGGPVSQRILQRLTQEPITDVILFSHGWKGDVPTARADYELWTRRMPDNVDDVAAIKRARAGFQLLAIGIHWPSLPFGDERLDSFSFGVGSPTLPAWTEDYVRRLGGTPEVRALVERAVGLATTATGPRLRLSDALAQTYRALASAAGLTANGVQGGPGIDQDEFEPNLVVDNTARVHGMPSFSLFDRDVLLSPLRQLSFWKMKDRARHVGETALNPLLVQWLNATAGRNVRFHWMGHSFGCIVASAAIAGPPGGADLPRPIDSLVLVQGAMSLWSYCSTIPVAGGAPGYFSRIVREGRVRGPIVTTQSKHDRAVGTFYPLGARLTGQVAFDVSLPKYGAVGAFGLQGPGLTILAGPMLSPREHYAFQAGTITNLESSDVIRNGTGVSGAHSDLNHEELAHAIWSALGT